MAGLYNVFKVYTPGEILTAADLNATDQQHVTFNTALAARGYSETLDQSRVQSSTQTLAVSLADELARLREKLRLLGGVQYWDQIDGPSKAAFALPKAQVILPLEAATLPDGSAGNAFPTIIDRVSTAAIPAGNTQPKVIETVYDFDPVTPQYLMWKLKTPLGYRPGELIEVIMTFSIPETVTGTHFRPVVGVAPVRDELDNVATALISASMTGPDNQTIPAPNIQKEYRLPLPTTNITEDMKVIVAVGVIPASLDNASGRRRLEAVTIEFSRGLFILEEPGMQNPMTALGDIIVGANSGTAERLGVGAEDQILTIVGGVPIWLDPPGGFTSPMIEQGDLIQGGTGGDAARLPIGQHGHILTVSGNAPSWQPNSAVLDPMIVEGDMIFLSSGTPTRLGIGVEGQVLSTISGYPVWTNAPVTGMTNPMTTLGDVITGGASGAPQRLAVGTNGFVLTIVAGVPVWAAPTGGGGFTNPMTAAGDIIIGGVSGAPTRLPLGATPGHVLTVAGVGTLGWAAAPGGGGVTFPLLAPDGSAATPSYSFAAHPTHGMFFHSGSGYLTVTAGETSFALAGPYIIFPGHGTLNWASGDPNATAQDVSLTRDGPGILAQKNGANPQRLRVYEDEVTTKYLALETFVGYGVLRASGTMYIAAEGTGNIIIQPAAGGSPTGNWNFNNSGHIYPAVDNVGDIGLPIVRVRSFYVGTSVNYKVTTAPATPGTGEVITYAKTDKRLYQKNDAGTELIIGTMSNPMTAAGDIVIGGASGTPTRLAPGSNNYVLTLIAGAPSWQAPSGGTFPLLAPDGVYTAPSYSFSGDTAMGMYRSGGSVVLEATSGGLVYSAGGSVIYSAAGPGGISLPVQTGTPATPATGYVSIYPKTDKKMYQKTDAGLETPLGGGGGRTGVDLPVVQGDLPDGGVNNEPPIIQRWLGTAPLAGYPKLVRTVAYYSATAKNYLLWTRMMPLNFGSSAQFRIKWYINNTSGNVYWLAGVWATSDGATEGANTWSCTGGSIVPISGGANILRETVITLTPEADLAANREVCFVIGRNADDPTNDTATDYAVLVAARFEYIPA